ncbi:MFS transporter [Labrys monachus]|uniref:EmrB/QacA subfamily drug resistance transporter n=1 Tax=Labrys monachus TaxID=217067 RepID=A0ABU0FNC1_9HYPH|nr:MFS transporter [Labrys monachus]MDQ0395867.1 EmrB/QacA subfamily drug resistance transporter [Labrys monachus]
MTILAATAPCERKALDPNRWAALAVLLTGAFLAPLDFFIVNVAMPSITTGLHATSADVQLVISGYAVVYSVFLITGGRLGDIYGRKAIFLIGLSGFATASAFCGLAWSPSALILARLLQALAAAAMAPQALASVHALFPPHERGRALSIYGIAIGLSSIVGQLLGGALVGADIGGLGWRLIFLINLPIAIVAFLAAIPLLRETRGQHRPRLDIGGVVLSSLALTALVLPLVEGRERGWPWWSVALLATTPFLVEAFRRYEIRLARAGGDPLVAIEAFRSKGLLKGLGAIMTLYAMATFFLTFSIYLQTALGFTALQSGLSILPFSAGFLAGSTFSPFLARLFGKAAPSLSFALSASGTLATAAVIAAFPAGALPPWPLLAPALALIGLGMGMCMPTMVRVIVERVEPHRAGLVGGLVNSTLQVSAAVSVAVLGGLFFTLLGSRSDAAAVTHAFAVTLVAIAACHGAGALLAAGLGQPRTASAGRQAAIVVE